MPNKTISRSNAGLAPPDTQARESRWKDLLTSLATSYWRDAEYVYRLAEAKKASFSRLQEVQAIHCIQGCLTEISLIVEQQFPRGEVESVRVERVGTQVRASSDQSNEQKSLLDLSKVVRSVTAASRELKPKESDILAATIIDQFFEDEIDLPGFAREVVNGDTVILTLLPDDAEEQLRYRQRRDL